MIISSVIRTLTMYIAQSILYINNTKDSWKNMRERFSKSNHFLIRFSSRNKLTRVYNSKSLWEKLDSLRP